MGGLSNRMINRAWHSKLFRPTDFVMAHTASGLVTTDGNAQTDLAVTVSSKPSVADADVIEQISTLKVPGVRMDTDGRTARVILNNCEEIDGGHPMYVRAHWTSGSTDSADTVAWKTFWKLISYNNDALTATVNAALDTVIPVDTNPGTSAWKYCVTSPGKINAGQLGAGHAAIFSVEMDTKDTDMSEALYLLALEILYVPRTANDTGKGRTPALPANWV